MGLNDGDKGKVPLSLGGPPHVIYPEIPAGERDEKHQQFMKYYKAWLHEREESHHAIGGYFANDTPSEKKGTTMRNDLELFFRGRVVKKVVPLLAELAQGMLSSM